MARFTNTHFSNAEGQIDFPTKKLDFESHWLDNILLTERAENLNSLVKCL